jgi:hypothetical protein
LVNGKLSAYITVKLMTEIAMTLVELMIENTPPHVVGYSRDRAAAGRWLDWLIGRFSWLEGHTDWNRKI